MNSVRLESFPTREKNLYEYNQNVNVCKHVNYCLRVEELESGEQRESEQVGWSVHEFNGTRC